MGPLLLVTTWLVPCVVAQYLQSVIPSKLPLGQPCPMFGDGRVSTGQWNLRNCTWHRENSCCSQQDVLAAFGELDELGLVLDSDPKSECRDAVTFLMCNFCSADQSLWYTPGEPIVLCRSLCDRVFAQCSHAFWRGQRLRESGFRDGASWCEAQNYKVVGNGRPYSESGCFGVDSDPEGVTTRYETDRRRLTETCDGFTLGAGQECPPEGSPAFSQLAEAQLLAPSRVRVAVAAVASTALLYFGGRRALFFFLPSVKSQVCPFFQNRAPRPEWGLKNCSWFRPQSCCLPSEELVLVESLEEMHVQDESLACQQLFNYLACWPCDPGQADFYSLEKQTLRICESTCDAIVRECGDARYKGASLKTYFHSGRDFCERMRFEVADEQCFKVYDGACLAPDWRWLPEVKSSARSSSSRLSIFTVVATVFMMGRNPLQRAAVAVLVSGGAASSSSADIVEWSRRLGEEFSNVTRDVLRVEEVQQLYDEANYSYVAYNGTFEAEKLAARMRASISRVEDQVENLKQQVIAAYSRSGSSVAARDMLPCRPGCTPESCAPCYYDVDLAVPSDALYDARYRFVASFSEWCAKVPDEVQRTDAVKKTIRWTQDEQLTEHLRRANAEDPELHYLAFGSPDGVVRQYPGSPRPTLHGGMPTDYDPRLRPWYLGPTSGPKDVVVVIDTSFSMRGARLRKAKRLASKLLDTLTAEDQVTVVETKRSFNGYWGETKSAAVRELSCVTGSLFPATTSVRVDMKNQIDALDDYGGSAPDHGLRRAYDLLFVHKKCERMQLVVYIGDGNRRDEQSDRYNDVARCGSGRWECCSCSGSSCCSCWRPPDPCDYSGVWGEASSLAERAFSLENVRTFVFDVDGGDNKENARLCDISKRGRGAYQAWEDGRPLYDLLSGWLTFLREKSRSNEKEWSSPYIDLTGSGLIASLSESVYVEEGGREVFLGVVSSALSLTSTEKLLLFDIWGTAYAFMIDREGEALIHPRLSAPSDLAASPVFPDIESLETYRGEPREFEPDVRQVMVRGEPGNKKLRARRLQRRGGVTDGVMVVEDDVEYHWSPVPDSDFVVGYVLATPDDVHYRVPLPPPSDWPPTVNATNYYHKLADYFDLGFDSAFAALDVQQDGNFNNISYNGIWVTGAHSVFVVSEGSLCQPDLFVQMDVDGDLMPRVHNLTNFRRNEEKNRCDNKQLLRERAFADIEIGLAVEQLWLSRDMEQYASFANVGLGTASGTYRFYPGYQLYRGFDPTKRAWYYAATANKDRISISTPYVAAGGEGVFVATAVPIFEGAPPTCDARYGHNGGCACEEAGECESGVCRSGKCTSVRVEAVTTGMRFYPALHARLDQLTDGACSSDEKRRCYLVDGAGYLIWAPQFAEMDMLDSRSFASVPLARFEGAVFADLERRGVFRRHGEVEYQGVCERTPAYLMRSIDDDGVFKTAKQRDEDYAGGDRGYFPPWSNAYGCVQDIVYYDVNESTLEDQGLVPLTGSVKGSCLLEATWYFAQVPGTNAFLLVLEDIVMLPAGEGFLPACAVENGLYTPGAYELKNGSCGLLHEVVDSDNYCPDEATTTTTDYEPRRCDINAAVSSTSFALFFNVATALTTTTTIMMTMMNIF